MLIAAPSFQTQLTGSITTQDKAHARARARAGRKPQNNGARHQQKVPLLGMKMKIRQVK
jgi:hypothetical protein